MERGNQQAAPSRGKETSIEQGIQFTPPVNPLVFVPQLLHSQKHTQVQPPTRLFSGVAHRRPNMHTPCLSVYFHRFAQQVTSNDPAGNFPPQANQQKIASLPWTGRTSARSKSMVTRSLPTGSQSNATSEINRSCFPVLVLPFSFPPFFLFFSFSSSLPPRLSCPLISSLLPPPSFNFCFQLHHYLHCRQLPVVTFSPSPPNHLQHHCRRCSIKVALSITSNLKVSNRPTLAFMAHLHTVL